MLKLFRNGAVAFIDWLDLLINDCPFIRFISGGDRSLLLFDGAIVDRPNATFLVDYELNLKELVIDDSRILGGHPDMVRGFNIDS